MHFNIKMNNTIIGGFIIFFLSRFIFYWVYQVGLPIEVLFYTSMVYQIFRRYCHLHIRLHHGFKQIRLKLPMLIIPIGYLFDIHTWYLLNFSKQFSKNLYFTMVT